MTIPSTDPVAPSEQEVRWTYWPVSYQFGDPTVISNSPLPLSGVKMSEVMRGVGELRAFLQLADPEVRALYPWDKVIPRKTGIVAVRETYDTTGQRWVANPYQHYVVWAAPRDPTTGRMEIVAQTVESVWARRLITKGITWAGQDQTVIADDLLDPAKWSTVALGAGLWPGWITVEPALNLTGVIRDFTYSDGQETSLLEAQQNRSQVNNGYEWRTGVRVLSGADAVSATTFRLQFVLGFPRLGRQLGDIAPVPRLRFDAAGNGNVLSFKYQFDGSQVPNIVWGRGNGYEDIQVKANAQNNEWQYGFLQTESRFSDPDVKQASTLLDYCFKQIWQRLSGEQFIASLKLRGDLPPYFGSYVVGDDLILDTNDTTWPDDYYGADGFLTLGTRIFGWTITPPQGNQSEVVELVVTGGDIS